MYKKKEWNGTKNENRRIERKTERKERKGMAERKKEKAK